MIECTIQEVNVMAKEPTIGKIEQLTTKKGFREALTGGKYPVKVHNPTTILSLEKRVKALEDQLPDPQSASQDHSDAFIKNNCGCVLPKEENVWFCSSPIGKNAQGHLTYMSSWTCRRCGMPLKYWVESKDQEEPSILVPGGF